MVWLRFTLTLPQPLAFCNADLTTNVARIQAVVFDSWMVLHPEYQIQLAEYVLQILKCLIHYISLIAIDSSQALYRHPQRSKWGSVFVSY